VVVNRRKIRTSEKETEMNTQRTRRRRAGRSILAEIDDLERQIVADEADAKLLSEAEGLAREEVKEVTTRGETDVSENIGDENARADDNWPMQGSERQLIASRLVALANKLLD
jgi:hypothetical protein